MNLNTSFGTSKDGSPPHRSICKGSRWSRSKPSCLPLLLVEHLMKKPIPFDDVFSVEEEFPSKWPNTFKVNMWSITWQETSLELTLNVTDLGDLLDHLLSGALFLPCIPSILKSLSQDQRGVSDHGKHCQRPFGASTKMEGGKRVHKSLASSKMYQSLPISSLAGGWFPMFFSFSPRQIGEDEPILRFFKGIGSTTN